MRRAIALAAILSTAVFGCGEDDDPEAAAELWQRIHVADYQRWQRPNGYESRQPSFTAHRGAVEIFMNDTMAKATHERGLGAWPAGAILVKDSYDGEHIAIVAAMEKRTDGWFFAEWRYDGKTIFSGKPSVCTDCHGRSKSDATWTVGLLR